MIVQIILFANSYSFAQSTYNEIEVYRLLLNKEAQDSSYHKALIKYGMNPAPVTEKAGATELTALSEAFNKAFWGDPTNYSRAFVLAVQLENRLNRVDDKQFAERRDAYVKLGEAYYIFKDYAMSVRLLENVIHTTPLSFWDVSHLEALRISGICYANMPGMMAKSDSCFMAMMLCDDMVLNRPVYNALALSNLGCNAMMQGDYDKALALDLEVLPRLKQEKDYGHIAGMYSCQGASYLGKGDYRGLRMVIDSISYYAHKDLYNRNKRLKQAYTLNGKYYSGVGDAQTALLYNDSLVAIYKAEESIYTSQFISYAQREVSDQEIRLREEQVERQRVFIFLVLIILGVIVMGMIIIIHLYRKRNAAYKTLAFKAKEWARESIHPIAEPSAYAEPSMNVAPLESIESRENIELSEDVELSSADTENSSALKEEPTQEDKQIMSLVEQKMVTEYTYREKKLTMNELADQLGVRRHLLSQAVNRVAGVNFYQYINGYRVKEAVRIISQKGREELHINDVYECVGFTNRTTFYRVFKQFTGLSPLEFQKSHKSGDKKALPDNCLLS